METESAPKFAENVDLLLACWLSGQIPEPDMLARLRADDLLRRRFEKRLGRAISL